MRIHLFYSVLFLLTITSVFAQEKVYTFCHSQTRNKNQQWVNNQDTGEHTVSITQSEIELEVAHEKYNLKIVTMTHLPDKGVIYLCKDEKLQDVTIMLIADTRMFLYKDTKRFLINFSQPIVMNDDY